MQDTETTSEITKLRRLFHSGPDVIYYRTFKKANYSFPTLEDAVKASAEMGRIIFENHLKLRMEFTSGVLNHIIQALTPNL